MSRNLRIATWAFLAAAVLGPGCSDDRGQSPDTGSSIDAFPGTTIDPFSKGTVYVLATGNFSFPGHAASAWDPGTESDTWLFVRIINRTGAVVDFAWDNHKGDRIYFPFPPDPPYVIGGSHARNKISIGTQYHQTPPYGPPPLRILEGSKHNATLVPIDFVLANPSTAGPGSNPLAAEKRFSFPPNMVGYELGIWSQAFSGNLTIRDPRGEPFAQIERLTPFTEPTYDKGAFGTRPIMEGEFVATLTGAGSSSIKIDTYVLPNAVFEGYGMVPPHGPAQFYFEPPMDLWE